MRGTEDFRNLAAAGASATGLGPRPLTDALGATWVPNGPSFRASRAAANSTATAPVNQPRASRPILALSPSSFMPGPCAVTWPPRGDKPFAGPGAIGQRIARPFAPYL